MKKVILGSLVAMMAVSAANAEIASVEYVGGKTGDIAQLTTTAKSNLTAAVNELNTGVQAAATKTELTEGLATKQATITDLTDIRSGAAAGATALQQAAIVNDAPSLELREKVAPSYDYTSKMIDEANTSIGDLGADLADLAGTVAGKADKATTLAGYGITDAMTATQINNAIATATEDMATTGDVSTAKDAAIAAAAADATTKADAAEAAAIAAAATDATTKADAAKDAAIAAAADAAKIYIDASELEASQTAQDTLLKDYADDAADAAEAAAIAAAATDATTKADAAEAAAIAAAATDATTKADAAEAAAIAAAATDATTKADAAKSAAIAAAAEAAKIYIDADELTASQNAQNTELKAYADKAESDANTFTTEQINNLGKLATLPTACAEGTSDCALVIRGGDIKWEKVQY